MKLANTQATIKGKNSPSAVGLVPKK